MLYLAQFVLQIYDNEEDMNKPIEKNLVRLIDAENENEAYELLKAEYSTEPYGIYQVIYDVNISPVIRKQGK